MSSLSEKAGRVLLAGACAFWFVHGVRWVRGLRRVPRIVPDSPGSPSFDGTLAVIVPACNEEEHIGPAMRSLLAHAPRGAMVVAVDDRSTDGTGQALDALAADDPRLRVLHVAALPPGWLGKTHALAVGAAYARRGWGEGRDPERSWLLFTDADVVFRDGGMGAAVRHAERRGLGHLVLYPAMDVRGFWETTFTTAFLLLFGIAYRMWEVNDPRAGGGLGIGAFNLVRHDAYERIGGHRALALEVADDVRLGQMLRRSGARQEAAVGVDVACVRWQHGLWGLITGLEKNAFAGMRYSVLRLAAATGGIAILNAPYAGAVFGRGPWRTASLGAIAMAALVYNEGEAIGGPHWMYFATFPLGTALMVVTMWRSALLALLRGGVRWRHTHYALGDLRGRRPLPAPPDLESLRVVSAPAMGGTQ